LRLIPFFFAREGCIYPENGCLLPFKSAVIWADGTVSPCYNLCLIKAGNVQREGLDKIYDSQTFSRGREIAKKRRCDGCLGTCSDLENYRMPEERDFKVKKIKYVLIKKLNSIYRTYCLESINSFLKEIKNKLAKRFYLGDRGGDPYHLERAPGKRYDFFCYCALLK